MTNVIGAAALYGVGLLALFKGVGYIAAKVYAWTYSKVLTDAVRAKQTGQQDGPR